MFGLKETARPAGRPNALFSDAIAEAGLQLQAMSNSAIDIQAVNVAFAAPGAPLHV